MSNKEYTMLSEVFYGIEEAKKFMKMNKVTPREIILVWEEEIDYDKITRNQYENDE